jgi:hypothetical protein
MAEMKTNINDIEARYFVRDTTSRIAQDLLRDNSIPPAMDELTVAELIINPKQDALTQKIL